MFEPTETEIKLASTPAMLEKLRLHPALVGEEKTDTLVTTYYDTADASLRRRGASLRIRGGAKDREQTLKLSMPSGSSVRRLEWTTTVVGDLPAPSSFPAKGRNILARLLKGSSLAPVATSRIKRTTRRLQFGGSTIEIAFDKGTIQVNGRKAAVCEFELELVEGQLGDVLALALQLPLGADLVWSVTSKAESCYLLAQDRKPTAAGAMPIKLTTRMHAAASFRLICWNCLGQLLANYRLVVASGDPDALHQSRVAIRRLRAACGLFKDVADDDEAPLLRAELKAVAAGLGPSRDLHVMIESVVLASKASGQNAGELLDHLRARKAIAMKSAQQLLAGRAFQRLLFQFALWIESGRWLIQCEEAEVDQPLARFASRALSKRRRQMRRRGHRVADMSDSARHRLRIDAKKFRYTVEFFAVLYRGNYSIKQRRTLLKALGRLQNSLGELNDMIVASVARKSMFEGLEPIAAARLSAQFKDLQDDRGKSRGKLLKDADRSLVLATRESVWWKAATRG